MELDIRKRVEEQEITEIRWCDGKGDHGTINMMDDGSCIIESETGGAAAVAFEEVDDLIAALQKYKELYS